ncbi:hypothetical protein TSUD_102650 [Trifolium subterraneum]|uniref:Uncharacterized protein n=1 Tax=Trifolium subterraneum TaxID=3900 RepID=A0A2Z6P275_TRISU|nr:hypothetical protein TSUD_102650 [Trifolium subterraneum]
MERKLACEPIDICCIVGLPFQKFPEVEPKFVNKYIYQLEFPWNIAFEDAKGRLERVVENLRGLFADFIKHFYQNSLRISADNGENYYCAVVRKRNPIWTIELGYNINFMCQHNNFEDGDLIRFKFDVDLRCHAYKIIKSNDDN